MFHARQRVQERDGRVFKLAFTVDPTLSGKLFNHRNTIARKIGLPRAVDDYIFKLVYKRCPAIFVLAQFVGCGLTAPFLMGFMPEEVMYGVYCFCTVCVAMTIMHSNLDILALIVWSFEYLLVLIFSIIFVVCYAVIFSGDPRGFAIIYIFIAIQAVNLYDGRARKQPTSEAGQLDRTYIGYNFAAVFWLGVLIVLFYGVDEVDVGFVPDIRNSTFQVFSVSQDVLSLMLSALEALFFLYLKFFVSSWRYPNRLVIVKGYIELSPQLQEEDTSLTI